MDEVSLTELVVNRLLTKAMVQKQNLLTTRIESIHGGHQYPRSTSRFRLPIASGQAGNPRQPGTQAASRRDPLSGHHRLRRDGDSTTRERGAVPSQFHSA